MTRIRTVLRPAMVCLAVGWPLAPHGQLVISDRLTGATSSYDWVSLNGACLTAGTYSATGTSSIPGCSGLPYYSGKTQVGGVSGRLPDPVGQGALRLSNGDTVKDGSNGNNQTGAVVSNFTFPSGQGLQVTFTSVTYGGNAYNTTGADGMAGLSGLRNQPAAASTSSSYTNLGSTVSATIGTGKAAFVIISANVTAMAIAYLCLYRSSSAAWAADATDVWRMAAVAMGRRRRVRWNAYAVVTCTVTLIPGRNGRPAPQPFTTAIRTGTRCTTFVKLPVELSGGSRAKRAPVAALRLSTLPSATHPG